MNNNIIIVCLTGVVYGDCYSNYDNLFVKAKIIIDKIEFSRPCSMKRVSLANLLTIIEGNYIFNISIETAKIISNA